MNLKTAASKLSVHYQTAYKLVRSGSLAAVKIGGTYEIVTDQPLPQTAVSSFTADAVIV